MSRRGRKREERQRAEPGEIIAVVRRVLAENGRDYIGQYVYAALCLIAVAATTAFSAWIMRDVVDEVFYRQRTDLLVVICLSIVAAFVIRGLASYAQAVILAKVGNDLVARYQRRVFAHLMTLGVGFFNENRSAQLTAQLNQNVYGIRDLLGTTLTAVARDVVSLVALVGVMVMQDPYLSLIALLIGPPLIFSVDYLMRRLRKATRESVEINSRLIGAIQEAAQGIAVVKAFTMEDQLSARIDRLVADAESRANRIARVSERLTPIAEILAGLVIAGVIGYAGYRASQGGQAPGAVFSFITALLLAYEPARRLAKAQVNLERALVNARMIYELLDAKPRRRDLPDATELSVSGGEIAFDRLSFAYPGTGPVLRDVSFTAAGGRTTAIVGPSGAGKSTLTVLLERFYEPTAGRILIDGQDISRVTKPSLRRRIAYVSQQPYLFEGTIRDNIRYGRADATDAEVEAAARQADADDFIRQQPAGYDTPVGEAGSTLSGGQRQRLSIARAILRDAPILLLDEATSALDNESEARVQDTLATIMQGRTTLVIAHRLSTVVNADRIIVMEDGAVVEQGTHQELLANPHGTYSRLQRLRDGGGGLGLVDDMGAPEKVSGQAAEAAAGPAVDRADA